MTAQIANIVVKSIAGRGLAFAANQALQKTVSVLFGHVGWIFTIIGGLSLITSLSNPRAYDKYIPAVFLIGSARLTQTIYNLTQFSKLTTGQARCGLKQC